MKKEKQNERNKVKMNELKKQQNEKIQAQSRIQEEI